MNRAFSIHLFHFFVIIGVLAVFPTFAQSSEQNLPTPITSAEIRGSIRARDIGDSRLTTYFYAFNGEQGDIFVNVLTRNFDGDIDIFTVATLRPLTKIVIYADTGPNETGRIVYLRKSEHMLLRIQGRTPDDNPASFLIKFAGSFVALRPSKRSEDLGSAPTADYRSGGVRLNSAGAIVPVTTKPKVEPPKVIIEDPYPGENSPNGLKDSDRTKAEPPFDDKPANVPHKDPATAKTVPDPLANVRLVILLKNGKRFECPMSEVLRFTADRGVLTVIAKDGTIVRYLMTDVASVSMQ